MMRGVIYSWVDLSKDIWRLLEGYRVPFTLHTTLRGLTEVAPALIAYCLGRIIDFFTQYQLGNSLNEVYVLLVIIAVSGILRVWVRFYAKLELYKIGESIRMKVRLLSLTKLIDIDLKWHEKEDTGSKIQKINSGSDAITDGMHSIANELLFIVSSITTTLVLFLFISLKYLLFTLAVVTIYLAVNQYFTKRMESEEEKLNKIKEKVSGKIHESASNLLTLKSLGLKKSFESKTARYEQQYYDQWLKFKKLAQLRTKLVLSFVAISYAIFIGILGFDSISGAISVGSIFVYASYFNRIREGLHQFTNKFTSFIQYKSKIGRLMKLIGVKTFEREGNKYANIPRNFKSISFTNVSFSYNKESTLKNFNLKIKRNEKIGVVGNRRMFERL